MTRSNVTRFSSEQITPSTSSSFYCDDRAHCERVLTYGGGRQHEFLALVVEPYITAGCVINRNCAFKFVDHVDSLGQVAYPIAENFIYANIPLCDIVPYLSVRVALKVARLHHLRIGSHLPKSEICRHFEGHNCISCNLYLTVFAISEADVVHSKSTRHRKHKAEKDLKASYVIDMILPDTTSFPPTPVNNELSQKIISNYCVDLSPSAMEEAGCAVCGQLIPVTQLTRLKGVKNMLHVLHAAAITRIERSDKTQPIREFKGPVLDHACSRICDACRQQVRNGKVPRFALANGLWLGAVPEVLSSLTYIERLLVARVRVNSCFIRVASSGLR
ncbi:hypothetical protein BYT27DRAFT_7090286, partial [Phlegmacium glaucopus]